MMALWKRLQAGERSVGGYGTRRVLKWERRALNRYVQAHTGKGDL